jgi:hypothetical protein
MLDRTHRRIAAATLALGATALLAACGSTENRQGALVTSPSASCTIGGTSKLANPVSGTATARFAWTISTGGTMSEDAPKSKGGFSAATAADATGLVVTMLDASGSSLGTANATCTAGSTKTGGTTTTVNTLPVVTTSTTLASTAAVGGTGGAGGAG